MRYSWFLILSVLILSGCVSRKDADAKLARGCAAGAELFLEEGYKIIKINDQIFRDDPKLGKGYREVRLFVLEGDGWYDTEQEYKCIFTESIGLFGMAHSATIYQLHMHDKTWGKKGDEIMGSFKEHLKLTETVEQGMNR